MKAEFTVLASEFNSPVVDGLLSGALNAFVQEGIKDDSIQVIRVPGAFELPLVAKKVAQQQSGRPDAIIALGAVIRGETPHFDYVCSECARGLQDVSLATGVPVIFGVLTTNTAEQAMARAGTERNKGADAVRAAIDMISILRQFD